jgi:flavin-dependent dehydrogenase
MVTLRNHHCDVFIAGAGPAGLAAAIALRLRGADVLLADARHPPIDKPCGEGLMPDARRALAALGVYPDPHGLPFAGIAFADAHARVSASFPTFPGVGLRRTTLHQLLCERAAALGVRFAFNTPVILGANQPPTLAGHFGSSAVRARWIIGADGASSRLRTWAGLDRARPGIRRFGFRAHFRLAPGVPPPTHVEVHWGPHGQAYITPVALHDGRAELCISAMTRDPHARLLQILDTLPTLRDLLRGAEPLTAERGCLTLTRRFPRVTRAHPSLGNVALIGDASGSVDAITGEGLALAFRQALLLADSIAADRLDLYESRHPALLALPQRMARFLLLLDRCPRLRTRTLHAFSTRPSLFRSLLAVHVGEQRLSRFLLLYGPSLASRIALPSAEWSS